VRKYGIQKSTVGKIPQGDLAVAKVYARYVDLSRPVEPCRGKVFNILHSKILGFQQLGAILTLELD
jgi:hypothetical protein